ncbi:MAG: SOS response-associated peptidase, partial [Acholeplasmataceae bacterium]|nr:SOS response-associated peptidase [Acholeplasmataceae bacterium]
LFTIAGLYHQSLNNNQDLNPTVAIITKKSGPNFDNIHKRIPALLNDDDKNLWLDENSETNTLLELIESFNEELIIYPISKRINNVKNNDKKLIHEVSKEPTLFNF